MTVREFDGVDDVIEAGVGALPGGGSALTVLCVWKPLAVEAGALVRVQASGGTAYAINQFSDSNVYFSNSNFDFGSIPYTAADGWMITGFSKAGGSAAAKAHKYVFATGTWTHPSVGTLSGPAATPDLVRFGVFTAGQFGAIRLAAVAVWGAALADATIETLGMALPDWLALSPAPAALWPFTQASTSTPVQDATGGGADQSAITGTTVVADDDPPGFDLSLTANAAVLTGTLPALLAGLAQITEQPPAVQVTGHAEDRLATVTQAAEHRLATVTA